MAGGSTARRRWAHNASACFFALLSIACTSNRFELANNPRRDREAEIAEIDRRLRQVPETPAIGVPAVEVPLVAGDPTPPPMNPDDALQPIPAATYPPPAVSPPISDQDPNAYLHDNPNRAEAGINNQPRLTETPRPGPAGSLLAPLPTSPQILGRVVNLYGRPEPNASIQVFDLTRGRKLVAELASGPDGRFNARNLETGVKYEVVAGLAARGVRYTGSTVVVAPDGAAVIRLEPENRSQTKGQTPDKPSLFGPDGLWSKTAIAGNAAVEPVQNDNIRISSPRLNRAPDSPLVNASVSSPTDPMDAAGASVPGPTTSKIAPISNSSPLNQLPIIQRDGTPNTLGQLAGDIILLDFFGSWCNPCRASIPHLNDLHAKYRDRGLHVVGIACENGNLPQQLQTVEATVNRFGITYTTLLTTRGLEPSDPVLATFNVRNYPTFVLVNREGVVLYRGNGASADNLRRLESAVDSALSKIGK